MKKVSVFAGIVLIIAFMGGCVMNSNVVIDSSPQGAEVRIDNQIVGETPVTTTLSNAIWENPQVRLSVDGYRDMYGGLRKEIKGVNLVVGIFLWFPSLLWCYGPDEYQWFDLYGE
jgi:PEGA domain-containing protein